MSSLIPPGSSGWYVGALVILIGTGTPLVWRTVRSALRGHFATDLVASLAIVGAALLRQPVAGLVIVIMQSGGEALERYAARRASRAIEELDDARPRTAHRVVEEMEQDIPADEVRVGDMLAVRPGELVPVDALVTGGESWIDTSRLTGESVPTAAGRGTKLLSGSVNGDRPLLIRALATAQESEFARIVDLVRSAQASKAPLQRLADRYAVWFTPLTLTVCATALLATRDWSRVLAILVVATPCPLIIATPVAIVGGISHAARHGIIVRHGGALEALSRITVAVFDKTGTLTIGQPEVSRVVGTPASSEDDVLRTAAAVERQSGHLLARSIVAEARRRALEIPAAQAIVERGGRGISGVVEGRSVAIGSRSFVANHGAIASALASLAANTQGALRSFLVVDGEPVGAIEFADRIRPSVKPTLRRLNDLGVQRTLLLSGDHPPYVDQVARTIGISEARGDLLPLDKVNVVAELEEAGERVLMVGDGVNDAPALSRAGVGIALAERGRSIASESADVVLLHDEFSNVAEAIDIGRKTMRVARESITVGLGLSVVAMVFAALGAITPTFGAALQEVIDVAVILNALRTSR